MAAVKITSDSLRILLRYLHCCWGLKDSWLYFLNFLRRTQNSIITLRFCVFLLGKVRKTVDRWIKHKFATECFHSLHAVANTSHACLRAHARVTKHTAKYFYTQNYSAELWFMGSLWAHLSLLNFWLRFCRELCSCRGCGGLKQL